jgi:hypothetical protein
MVINGAPAASSNVIQLAIFAVAKTSIAAYGGELGIAMVGTVNPSPGRAWIGDILSRVLLLRSAIRVPKFFQSVGRPAETVVLLQGRNVLLIAGMTFCRAGLHLTACFGPDLQAKY